MGSSRACACVSFGPTVPVASPRQLHHSLPPRNFWRWQAVREGQFVRDCGTPSTETEHRCKQNYSGFLGFRAVAGTAFARPPPTTQPSPNSPHIPEAAVRPPEGEHCGWSAGARLCERRRGKGARLWERPARVKCRRRGPQQAARRTVFGSGLRSAGKGCRGNRPVPLAELRSVRWRVGQS